MYLEGVNHHKHFFVELQQVFCEGRFSTKVLAHFTESTDVALKLDGLLIVVLPLLLIILLPILLLLLLILLQS